jgi:hypothetical protein
VRNDEILPEGQKPKPKRVQSVPLTRPQEEVEGTPIAPNPTKLTSIEKETLIMRTERSSNPKIIDLNKTSGAHR